MSGKGRPSLRKKTLFNVCFSSLSKTDKECIRAVFELAERQQGEIETLSQELGAALKKADEQQALAMDRYYEIERLKVSEYLSPCDLCVHNPPSSFGGKPCAVCPAQPKECDQE